ncbi:MAG: M23 family metallopeptidase [Oscillospiraceae bacterium]|jgi:murein DD-endopeptidase MepM/ murein hydrolase activator NlpD|nr:M23 family metallopeptidase [Oscillospiraceae bacterium]
MVYQDSDKKGIGNLLKNRGFYAIAGLCLVAAGTGIFAARQTDSNPPPAFPATIEQQATIPWQPLNPTAGDDSAVNKPATNIPDERTAPESTAAPTTAKPNPNTPYTGEYSLPFGTDILRDYSNGDLVYVPTLDDWRSHDGVDFSGAPGNDILAIQDGTVKSVSNDDLWGTVVEIDHGNGLLARYCGFDKANAPKDGTKVKRDAVLGKLGAIPCEAIDAPHLHLEIRVNGKLVDPLAAMNKLGEQN